MFGKASRRFQFWGSRNIVEIILPESLIETRVLVSKLPEVEALVNKVNPSNATLH